MKAVKNLLPMRILDDVQIYDIRQVSHKPSVLTLDVVSYIVRSVASSPGGGARKERRAFLDCA